MPYSANTFRLGPEKTPKVIKFILLTTILASILFALISDLHLIRGIFNPQYLFSLSLDGISQGFLWQLITYPFIQFSVGHIELSFLISLALNAYLLWVFGSQIVSRYGTKHFLSLYFFSAIFSGLIALGVMGLMKQPIYYGGSLGIVYTILISWLMLYPDLRLLLFFLFPIQAKWLILGLLAINLLIDLSHLNMVPFSIYLASAVFGYCYAFFVWKCHSPFLRLHNVEKKIFRFRASYAEKRQKKKEKRKTGKSFHPSKIYDFKTGEPVLDDDQFMDAMLSKISLYGKDSLSPQEQKRMEKISKNKLKG